MQTGDWKQKKYKTWDEAFRGLAPAIRQQSVRVADYTQVLFLGACVWSNYAKDPSIPLYMHETYAEVAYKCGLYHQLGKALMPAEYQIWREDFTEEEKQLYRKYTTDGKELVTKLQGVEDGKADTSCRMIRKACEQHMERWDGTGYPLGYKRQKISLIAQIVGLAKELDALVSEIRSENPFEEAFGILIYRKGTWFSDDLIEVMKDCRTELKEVYKKYIQYTNTVPKVIPLVEKRAERPFGLLYRPVILNGKACDMYEAVPWFQGVAEMEGEHVSMNQVEGALTRTSLLKDMSQYLLYEAADTMLRLKNWGYGKEGILVPMFDGFYQDESSLELLQQLFEDQPIEKTNLKLAVSGRFLKEAENAELEALTSYMKQGITLVLDHYEPDDISMTQIHELGIVYVRISEKISDAVWREEITKELHRYGISVVETNMHEPGCTEEELIRGIQTEEMQQTQ